MLEAHDLACIRGERRLFRRLSFQAAAGQLLHVQGANGSGKTSLLRLLAGLALPSAGEVRWRGQPVRREREAFARELLYLGHLPALKDELSARDNLAWQQRLAGNRQSAAALARSLEQALAQMGLAREIDLPVRRLSAGQRRRAALARLQLAAAAPLWILDEPFTALDAAAVQTLSGVIAQHVATGGCVVLTTHLVVDIAAANLASLRVDEWA